LKSNCYKCKERPPLDKSAEIKVGHTKFYIKKSGLCTDCLTKEFDAGFGRLAGKEFVTKKDGAIEINWKMINGLEEEDQNFAYDVLIAMDILSLSIKDSWQIVAYGGIMLNPRHFLSILYFKKKQYAIDFAIAMLGNTLYSWEIQHITNVLTRPEIMGQK